ncbi:MAG: hypothetical protein QOF13_1710 [Solirubrobacterales bacterium]|nr:hypothetical protein [Solirubrobacterales bacterium]
MRLLKMFSLAAIAAVAAMAFIGASSASAQETALCTSDVALVCASPYTGHIEGVATSAPRLLSNLANVTCENSVILGNALGLASASNGTAQLTHIELIDFTGNCKTELGVSCTVTTITLGLADLLKTGSNQGTLTSLGNEVRVVCLGVINCTFGGEPSGSAVGASLPLSSSSLGTITVFEAPLTGKGSLCPAVGKWDANYAITLPHELFITN